MANKKKDFSGDLKRTSALPEKGLQSGGVDSLVKGQKNLDTQQVETQKRKTFTMWTDIETIKKIKAIVWKDRTSITDVLSGLFSDYITKYEKNNGTDYLAEYKESNG